VSVAKILKLVLKMQYKKGTRPPKELKISEGTRLDQRAKSSGN
jgi:hypothetical protein